MKTVGHVRNQHELKGHPWRWKVTRGDEHTWKKQEITPNSSPLVMLNMIPEIFF